MTNDPWIRLALALFPPGFRERRSTDLLETVEDVIAHAAPAEHGRLRRRIRWQLARAALAENLTSLAAALASTG
ncbi:MAG: hypothetical protein MI919_08505, partial [Holophagales bacterium]|nr:hypothetical protein [Holophagales bacterium]